MRRPLHSDSGEPARQGASDRPEAAPAPHVSTPAAILALQRSAGNQATVAALERGPKHRTGGRAVLQRDPLKALGRGWDMYWGMDDEGASFARQLMEWRVTGLGTDFDVDPGDYAWNRFMSSRPEIHRGMLSPLERIAKRAASDGPTDTGLLWDSTREYTDTVRGVALNELESMRLTLHGCHRIEITAEVKVRDEGVDRIVEFTHIRMKWVDRADLHAGTKTELDSGEEVDDSEFSAAGWDYDIFITFDAPEESVWRVAGSTASKQSGWPPTGGGGSSGGRG